MQLKFPIIGHLAWEKAKATMNLVEPSYKWRRLNRSSAGVPNLTSDENVDPSDATTVAKSTYSESGVHSCEAPDQAWLHFGRLLCLIHCL